MQLIISQNNHKILTSEFLIKEELGVIIHGGAIVINECGFVFSGESTAGKTTLLLKLLPFGQLINDDKICLVKLDGKIITFSPPLKGEDFELEQSNKTLFIPNLEAKINSFFIVEKEFIKQTHKEIITDKDFLWKFLINQSGPPIYNKSLFPKYYKLVDYFIENIEFFVIRHNIKDSPDFVKEVIVS